MSLIVALIVVSVGLAARWPAAWALLAGFALLTPLERACRRHRQPVRRAELATDVVHFVVTGMLNTGATVAGALLVWAPLHRLRPASLAAFWPTAPLAAALTTFAVFTFGAYWHHRLSHTVGWLWRFHAVHHSSATLDWVAAARLHPVEGLGAGVMVAPMFIALGLRPGALAPLSGLATLWAVLLHANVSWRLPRLGLLFGSPELHHWHHACEPGVPAANFSGLAPWLDKLFGTYWAPADRRPQRYGTSEPVPATWWGQLAHPFRAPPTRPTASPGA